MITDKVVKVATSEGEYTIILTGQQIEQTVRRRVKTLVPQARILDLHEVVGEAQTDLLSRPTKRAK